MYCKKCGAELKDSAKFCTSCGAKTDVVTSSNNKGNANTKKIIIAVVITIVVIIAAVVGWQLITGSTSEDNAATQAVSYKKLDYKTLKLWLTEGYTESRLRDEGYTLQLMENEDNNSDDKMYSINGTDVTVVMCSYDPDKITNGVYYGETLQDRKLLCVLAPAIILIPDKIGESIEPFIDGDILFMPQPYASDSFGVSSFATSASEDSSDEIGLDSLVSCTSKQIMGNSWDMVVKNNILN